MRKAILMIIFAFTLVTLGAIDFQIGPAAMFVAPISAPEDIPSYNSVGPEDFRFGVDTRLSLGFLQAALLALYEAPGVDALLEPGRFIIVPTAGISMKFVLLELGVGLGPAIQLNVGDPSIPDPADVGLQLKGTLDVVLGPISVGLITGTALNLTGEGDILGEDLEIFAGLVALYRF